MLDDLRNQDDDLEFDEFDDFDDDDDLPIDFDEGGIEIDEEEESDGRGFLGMSAGERTLLVVFFFLNVIVYAAAILIMSNRIGG